MRLRNKIQDILDNYNYNDYKSINGFQKWLNGLSVGYGGIKSENFTAKEIITELEKLQTKGSIQEIYDFLTSYQRTMLGAPDLDDRETAIKLLLEKELGLAGKDQKEILSMTASEYNALMQKIISYIQSYNAKIESDMNQVHTALFQETYSKDKFWAIENNDIRDDITTFLSSIDSNIWDALNIKTENDLSTFVNKIIESLANNKDGFNDAWNGLFNPDLKDLPVGEYAKQIDDFIGIICNTLDLDEAEGAYILKIALGFDDSKR